MTGPVYSSNDAVLTTYTGYTKAEVDAAITNVQPPDWLSESDGTATATHYIDTGPTNLIVRAGTESALQVLGTDNGAAAGDIFAWKGMTVGNSMFVGQSLSVGQNLTVGGTNVIAALDNTEIKFTAVAPLSKGVNLQTGEFQLKLLDNLGDILADNIVINGNLTVNGTSNISGVSSNPFFCAGRVDGATASVVSSIGSVGYTVARASGQTQGVWEIKFNSPAPNNDYIITLTNMNYGTIYLWDANPPNQDGFDVVIVNKFWNLTNAPFHFSVVV